MSRIGSSFRCIFIDSKLTIRFCSLDMILSEMRTTVTTLPYLEERRVPSPIATNTGQSFRFLQFLDLADDSHSIAELTSLELSLRSRISLDSPVSLTKLKLDTTVSLVAKDLFLRILSVAFSPVTLELSADCSTNVDLRCSHARNSRQMRYSHSFARRNGELGS